MRGWKLKGNHRYRDAARDRGLDCPSSVKSVPAETLEATAAELLMAIEFPPDWRDRVVEIITQNNPSRVEEAAVDAVRQVGTA